MRFFSDRLVIKPASHSGRIGLKAADKFALTCANLILCDQLCFRYSTQKSLWAQQMHFKSTHHQSVSLESDSLLLNKMHHEELIVYIYIYLYIKDSKVWKMRRETRRKHENVGVERCQERWIKMERPRASLLFCPLKGQSESKPSSVCVCVCVCVCSNEGVLSVLVCVSWQNPWYSWKALIDGPNALIGHETRGWHARSLHVCLSKCQKCVCVCVCLQALNWCVCVCVCVCVCEPPVSALCEPVSIPSPDVSSRRWLSFNHRRASSRRPSGRLTTKKMIWWIKV